MASDVVIRAEGLGKKYVIGHQAIDRAPTLRDALVRTTHNFMRTAADMLRGQPIIAGDDIEEFWALKDISFEIHRGDVVGIIGRNGAGKSTLLKVLSRITEPTEGRVTIQGRVASLLEVGTGFHPELTGRENIYLNGALLGMTHNEIRRKFDEIVAFAEVERFLDTPVKRYSSGMYVRLAFAVAAHLEPEILIVDEVLAVGDAEFQKKCLGKMQDVAGHGRTVLFVSHNMAAISQLCTQGLLLAGGNLAAFGPLANTLSAYAGQTSASLDVSFSVHPDRTSIERIAINPDALASGDLVVDIYFESPAPLTRAHGAVLLRSTHGQPVWGTNSTFHPPRQPFAALRRGRIRCTARDIPLVNDTYLVTVWLGQDPGHALDVKHDALSLTLIARPPAASRPPSERIGHLDWQSEWLLSGRPLQSEAALGASSTGRD